MTEKRGRLHGQLAIVTGAANGAGAASARLFAQEQANVIVVDIDDAAGAAVAEEIRADGGQAWFQHCDVSAAEQVAALAQSLAADHGSPDILFNHAGTVIVRSLIDTTLAEWERLMTVNVTSMFLMVKAFLPAMIARRSGVILNTSSISGFTAAPLESAYCVSKGAILQLTRAVAVEYRQYGIRCNAICPGFIDTNHGRNEVAALQAQGEEISGSTIAAAQGRMCTPEEFAATALGLVSPDSVFMNGASVVIDNGSTVLT